MGMQERIRTLRIQVGLRQKDVAAALGVDPSAVSQWETGRTLPSRDKISQLARLFECTEQAFFTDSNQDEWSLSDEAHLDASHPSPAGADRPQYDAQSMAVSSLPMAATVPLLEFSHSPVDIEYNSMEKVVGRSVEVPASVLRIHPRAQAIQAEDDCMDRVVPLGAIIIYDPDLPPSNGRIVVVHIENKGTVVRRWFCGQNTLLLSADSHQQHEDIVMASAGSLQPIGTVILVQVPFELL